MYLFYLCIYLFIYLFTYFRIYSIVFIINGNDMLSYSPTSMMYLNDLFVGYIEEHLLKNIIKFQMKLIRKPHKSMCP